MRLFLTFFFCFCCSAFLSLAQIKVSYSANDASGIVIHADSRLAIVTKSHAPQQRNYIRSTHGFRVQIYSGSDRAKASEIKLDFMRRFPGVRTYMTYSQPQFRVKVGDFATRAEAQKIYQQVSTLYSPCMIVPDIVELNNTQKDD